MTYLDLDGKSHKLNLSKYMEKPLNKSELHVKTRNLLKQIFPCFNVFEECGITVKRGRILYLDFILPELQLIVEPCGKQHYVFTPFFHKTKSEFLKGRQRDVLKRNWCTLNNFRLVELRFDEQELWHQQLCKA